MEEKPPVAKVIAVMTIGMDTRKQAIFRMAFRMYSVQRYALLDDAGVPEPDIAIIDWDAAGVQSLWDDFRARYPALPAVAVTVTPTEDMPVPAVAKPVRMEALFPMLRQALAGETVRQPKPAATVEATNAPRVVVTEAAVRTPDAPRSAPATVQALKPAAPVAAQLAAAVAQPRAAQPAAPQPAQPATPRVAQPAAPATRPQGPPLPATIDRFNARTGVLGVLREIRAQRVPTLITIAGADAIIALPGQDSVLLCQDMAVIRRACVDPGAPVSTRQLTPQDASARGASQCGFTALLWQISLWTSRGRLLEGIEPDTPVRLRQWPNLTRLAPTPEAMRIAALWMRFPINLRLTVRMLNVHPGHVFDFLAASHSIGILDIRESHAQAVTLAPPPPAMHEDRERSGMLSRLLRKIVRL